MRILFYSTLKWFTIKYLVQPQKSKIFLAQSQALLDIILDSIAELKLNYATVVATILILLFLTGSLSFSFVVEFAMAKSRF